MPITHASFNYINLNIYWGKKEDSWLIDFTVDTAIDKLKAGKKFTSLLTLTSIRQITQPTDYL